MVAARGPIRDEHHRWNRMALPRPDTAVTNTAAAGMPGNAQARAAMASG